MTVTVTASPDAFSALLPHTRRYKFPDKTNPELFMIEIDKSFVVYIPQPDKRTEQRKKTSNRFTGQIVHKFAK